MSVDTTPLLAHVVGRMPAPAVPCALCSHNDGSQLDASQLDGSQLDGSDLDDSDLDDSEDESATLGELADARRHGA